MAAVRHALAAEPVFAFIVGHIAGYLLSRKRLPMRSREPESLLLVPLLPIFLVGAFPMLLLSLLGFAGLVIFGILMICVGFTDMLESNSAFSEQLIVHGYTRPSERAVQRTHLRTEMRFAFLMIVAGAGMAGAGLCGFFYYG
jgi:hypothetical protein